MVDRQWEQSKGAFDCSLFSHMPLRQIVVEAPAFPLAATSMPGTDHASERARIERELALLEFVRQTVIEDIGSLRRLQSARIC